ncbi:hypothetical protein ACQEVZ_06010 [Dactylosporangium sp. CA-152071]|uniref:hypothetical protein n=1 Tax=Dactylosporangium sp. CA-152071 TaxID=3239933 RepID=UPI003D8EE210
MAMTLQAVLEIPFRAPDPVPWPVATREPGAWLTLDGTCGDLEIGLFAAVVAGYNNIPPGKLATAEHLIAPGGLILTDPTTVITPGCCCGLEDWRDWARALVDNEPPWLGHDPTPTMSIGDRITVWQDTGPPENHAPILSGPHITLTRAHLADLLQGVHRDLTAFTTALAAWAERQTTNGPALTATIDAAFAFTAPLPPSAI